MGKRMLGVSTSIPDLDGMELSIEDSITATPSGTQGISFKLNMNSAIHVTTTVASGNDGVDIPILATGSHRVFWIYNAAASNSLQVFPKTPDTIDAITSATGVAIAAGRGRMFYDYQPGKWITFYGA